MTRQQAIRARCMDCVGYNTAEVRRCENSDCPLHPYRLTSSGGRGEKADAIRQYCLDCCNGSAYERSHCTAKNCPLYDYRNLSASRAAGFGLKTHDSTVSDD